MSGQMHDKKEHHPALACDLADAGYFCIGSPAVRHRYEFRLSNHWPISRTFSWFLVHNTHVLGMRRRPLKSLLQSTIFRLCSLTMLHNSISSLQDTHLMCHSKERTSSSSNTNTIPGRMVQL